MVGHRDYHTEWSKSDKDKYHLISLIYLKYYTNEFILKNRNRLTDIENKLMATKEEKCGGGVN